MNGEARHSSLLEETMVDNITTAMEEEERALNEKTSREQQQLLDNVENCRSIASTLLFMSL